MTTDGAKEGLAYGLGRPVDNFGVLRCIASTVTPPSQGWTAFSPQVSHMSQSPATLRRRCPGAPFHSPYYRSTSNKVFFRSRRWVT
jgi:hypothetical protein